jgi:hypothetical protein
MKQLKVALSIMTLLLALPSAANAQTITGSVFGSVGDPAGAPVAGAIVQLIHDSSKQSRRFETDSSGGFEFISVIPGAYTLKITQPGFKTSEQSVTVSAQERVDVHTIRLTVGDVSTTIEVQGEVAHVATDSSDRAQNISLAQINDTPVRGRDYLGLLKSLPGVQDINNHDLRGWGADSPTINGGQMGQIVITIDGIVNQDSGYGNSPAINVGATAPGMDAIAEVKLLVSNYTAEYGARNGGQLNVTIKNGTNRFHGTAFYDWRHEELNANEFFNNKLTVAKPRTASLTTTPCKCRSSGGLPSVFS